MNLVIKSKLKYRIRYTYTHFFPYGHVPFWYQCLQKFSATPDCCIKLEVLIEIDPLVLVPRRSNTLCLRWESLLAFAFNNELLWFNLLLGLSTVILRFVTFDILPFHQPTEMKYYVNNSASREENIHDKKYMKCRNLFV